MPSDGLRVGDCVDCLAYLGEVFGVVCKDRHYHPCSTSKQHNCD